MGWKRSVRVISSLITVAQMILACVLRRGPEEGGQVLRAKVRDGRLGDEEPTRAGRDRRTGRRQRRNRRDDRRGRRAAEERAQRQHR